MDFQVFLVNRGDMLLFDLSLAMQKVSTLQQLIAKQFDIPVESQVLLISGGGVVNPEDRVCTYTSGRESCPIFLFNLKAIEEKNPPEMKMDNIDRDNIRQRIEGSMNMAPTLVTLSTRTQLALELKDLSLKYEKLCKELVYHQHLQNQGWCTALAHLEDSVESFVQQADQFVPWYQRLLEKKPQQMEMLENFPSSCELLARMPILSSLSDYFSGSISVDSQRPTLLHYCTTLDHTHEVLAEAQKAREELSQLSFELLNEIVYEKEKALLDATNQDMKHIKGLENRLYNLEKIKKKADTLVKSQIQYAESFVLNQKRCKELADPHILPDLCVSHKEQLRIMEKEWRELRDCVLKCHETKRELGANLHARFRWMMYVQKVVSSLFDKIYMQSFGSRNLKLRLERLEQICKAPAVYAQLCVEMCRRKRFNSMYKSWSQQVYERSTELYEKEVQFRKEFLLSIGANFLREFFPGLDKAPPIIMQPPPPDSDEGLPAVSEEEITSLRELLPELTEWLKLPDDTDCQLSVAPSTPQCSPTAANTPSDITVLSPRTNRSSSSSIAAGISSTDSGKGVTMVTTAESMPTDSYTGTLGDDMTDQPHMMARCEQLSGEDLSEDEDDRAPTSLSVNDENSGGYTTAEFYLCSMPQSPTTNNMAETITMQNSEIDQLISENNNYKQKLSVYQQKYDQLKTSHHNFKQTCLVELQQLREDCRCVRGSVSTYGTNFQTFRDNILKTVQRIPALEQEELDKQLAMCRSEYDNKIAELSEMIKCEKLKHEELKQTIESLRKDKSTLLEQIEELSASKTEEIKVSVYEAESVVTKRLTLEYELELDEVKSRLSHDLEVSTTELAATQKELVNLQTQVESLNKQLAEESASTEQHVETLNREFVTTLDEKVADLNSHHENEKKTLIEQLKLAEEKHLQKALEEQKMELSTSYVQQIQAMTKPTSDTSVNTDIDYLEEEMSRVQQECDTDKRKALEDQCKKLQADFEEKMETQRQNFMDQIKQLRESHEQEAEYRAYTMRESLQIAAEMRTQEKLDKIRREKDAIIAELRRQLRDTSARTITSVSTIDSSMVVSTTSTTSTEAMATSTLTTATGGQSDVSMSVSAIGGADRAVSTTEIATSTTITDEMGASVVPISVTESVMVGHKALEVQLQEKESIIKELQSKISEFKMSASVQAEVQNDKVSVKSCSPGDKVILCYDQQYEHYIVLCLGKPLHFLHSDSTKELGIGNEDTTKPWIMAEIVDKEYCMARKSNNRFRVPVNTKFYRVKAKPWGM